MAAQKARALVHKWAESHEKHLAHEEHVLMPLTQKVPGAVGPHTVRLILLTDFAAFKANMLPYAIKQLAKTKPYPGLEVYVRAVQVSRSAFAAEISLTDSQPPCFGLRPAISFSDPSHLPHFLLLTPSPSSLHAPSAC